MNDFRAEIVTHDILHFVSGCCMMLRNLCVFSLKSSKCKARFIDENIIMCKYVKLTVAAKIEAASVV